MMTDWLFSWRGVVAGALLLLGAVILAVTFREGPWGNVASIVGLAVSVLGFVVTIWTVLDARSQIKEASQRAERAIAAARAESRTAVERIATMLFAADCAALRSELLDLRRAAQDARWPRAVSHCEVGQALAYRLAGGPHLTREEAVTLGEMADDLAKVLRFIERYRLAGQPGALRREHRQRLDAMLTLLAQILGRLHHEALRPAELFPDNQ